MFFCAKSIGFSQMNRLDIALEKIGRIFDIPIDEKYPRPNPSFSFDYSQIEGKVFPYTVSGSTRSLLFM